MIVTIKSINISVTSQSHPLCVGSLRSSLLANFGYVTQYCSLSSPGWTSGPRTQPSRNWKFVLLHQPRPHLRPLATTVLL